MADLSMADLSMADLSMANLRGADLRMANLRGADLSMANLSRAKNVPFLPMTCPDSGSFTAYKKASGKIVKLLVPEDARRSSATGRKCRCDKALVVEIQNIDGTKADVDHVSSDYDEGFVYTVGEMVSEPDFYEDRFEECAEGIHFFINRQEAIEYGE
jgi:hypothetical protein